MKIVLASSLLGVLSVGAFHVSMPATVRSNLLTTSSRSTFMVSQLSESAVDDVEATADAAADANEEAKSTKKVERERHTIFIGNIDFGTYLTCVSEPTKHSQLVALC